MPSFWLQLFEGVKVGPSASVVRLETADLYAAPYRVTGLDVQDVRDLFLVPAAVIYCEFRNPFGNMIPFPEMLPA
jgi:hypothetical protein